MCTSVTWRRAWPIQPGALLALGAAGCLGLHASSAQAGYVGRDLYTLALPGGFMDVGISHVTNAIVGQQVVGSASVGGATHALLWNGTGAPVDLNPTNLSGFIYSAASATDGTRQVGLGARGNAPGAPDHALFWSGTSDSAIDLNPTNLPYVQTSAANGVAGTQIVGMGANHALLWNSVGTVAVDLHPTNLPGFDFSNAFGTDGHHQMGFGGVNGSAHALLWSGTADSAVDLHPTNLAGYNLSLAVAVSGSQVVGAGTGPAPDFIDHAMLWTGTADSAVDLNPSGFTTSDAVGTNGTLEVGFGSKPGLGGTLHALLWSGSAASAIDLNDSLPSGFGDSLAYSFDSTGDIFGTATNAAGKVHAVEWVLPEPSALALLAALATAALHGRRRPRLDNA